MKIVRLQSENVKRLRAVEVIPDPNGSLVVIRGENGAGKSSVLDSIAYALGGRDIQPPMVIRDGQDKAQVVVDLGDLVVERRWTANDRTYLEVRGKDGATHKSPQALLDKMVGSLAFDPLAFMRLPTTKQAETLRELVGLDFVTLDTTRQQLFEERTIVNREGKALKARYEAMPAVEAPSAPVSIDELLVEQAGLLAQKEENERTRRSAQEAEAKRKAAEAGLAKARTAVEDLERQIAHAREAVTGWEKALEREIAAQMEIQSVVAALTDPDIADVYRRIKSAQATNDAVRREQERDQLGAELETKRKESAALAEKIAAIDATKATQLATAKFPVPGLSMDDVGLTLNGIPLEQASSAEQLRVSLAMGLALNPTLKVLLIRDGSLLDQANLGLVGEMAAAAGAQVWLEVVGKGGVGVVIEDGQVESTHTESPPPTNGTKAPAPQPKGKQAKAPF